MMAGDPVISTQSPRCTEAAWTRTRIWSSATRGRSISRASRTSKDPYRSWTIAFILESSAVGMVADVADRFVISGPPEGRAAAVRMNRRLMP
jgi:hypothetical protein